MIEERVNMKSFGKQLRVSWSEMGEELYWDVLHEREIVEAQITAFNAEL